MTTTTIKTTRRNKPRKQQRNRRNVTTVSRVVSTRQPRRRQNKRKTNQLNMSRDGMAFLKCAYAALDFDVGAARGIPDQYIGKSLTSDVSTSRALGLAAGFDTYIVVLPTPGIAHWSTTTLSGVPVARTNVWTPYYDKSFGPIGSTSLGTLFGDQTDQSASGINPLALDRTRSVVKFRYVSNTIEITCTSSPVGTSGSIQVWHGDVNMNLGNLQVNDPDVGPALSWTEYDLGGMDFTASIPRSHYTNHIMKGAYAVTVNSDQDFAFQPIISGVTRIPGIGLKPGNAPLANNPTFGAWNGDVVGLGDMNAICIKITSPVSAVNSILIDTRSCIEYQPNVNSVFEQYCGVSAVYDPLAIQAYRQIAKQLPVAVPRDANDGFWDDIIYPNLVRFLKLAKTAGEYSGVVAGILGIVL